MRLVSSAASIPNKHVTLACLRPLVVLQDNHMRAPAMLFNESLFTLACLRLLAASAVLTEEVVSI